MAISEGIRRVSVILDQEVDEALSAIVAMTGQPVATVVREMLREAAPGLKAYAQALSAVHESPKQAAALMVREIDRQTIEFVQASLPLRAKRGRKPKE